MTPGLQLAGGLPMPVELPGTRETGQQARAWDEICEVAGPCNDSIRRRKPIEHSKTASALAQLKLRVAAFARTRVFSPLADVDTRQISVDAALVGSSSVRDCGYLFKSWEFGR